MGGFPNFLAPHTVVVPAIFAGVVFTMHHLLGTLTAHRIGVLLFCPATVVVKLVLRLDLVATQAHLLRYFLAHVITSTENGTTRRVRRTQILP